MNGINTLLFIPIEAVLPAGENAEAELRSRFFIFSYTRTGKKEYLFSKAIGLLVSGGFLTFLAMVFLMVVSIIRFGHIPALMPEEVNVPELYSKTLLSFPRIFLNGALGAGVRCFQEPVYGIRSAICDVLRRLFLYRNFTGKFSFHCIPFYACNKKEVRTCMI